MRDATLRIAGEREGGGGGGEKKKSDTKEERKEGKIENTLMAS